MYLNVHSYDEPIPQNRNEDGDLPHVYTSGKSKFHRHIWRSFGLGCGEVDCEMNNHSSKLYIELRIQGF